MRAVVVSAAVDVHASDRGRLYWGFSFRSFGGSVRAVATRTRPGGRGVRIDARSGMNR